MIKQILEQTVTSLENQKAREISTAKERVTREKIVPYNNEINQSRDKAIAELQASLNSQISALQKKFGEDKQALMEAGEKKKADFAEVTISTEVALVSEECDKAISKIKSLINDAKE